jgi:D-glycero-D-manno-heptose 1,7-bisphosphate phosphatase
MNVPKTLFLDRDGVINELLPMDYVKTPDEFVFRDGVLEALSDLSQLFDYIIIVTNQQGVAKGLMSHDDLDLIHQSMVNQLNKVGVKITKIYACTHLKEDDCQCRKPKPGMLDEALRDFPDISFTKSILIGDSPSDIDMANSSGIISVAMIHSNNQNISWNSKPDYTIHNLKELKLKVLSLIDF